MGKRTFAALIVAVVAMFAGYNIYTSQSMEVLSELTLSTIESVAGCEVSATGPNNGVCTVDVNTKKEYCVKGIGSPACSATI